MKPFKLVVVGVGHVGSYVLADAMKLGLFGEIALIDSNAEVARGEALDQTHAAALTSLTNVHVHAGDYDTCADADIIVVAAGPSVIPDPKDPTGRPDRSLLATANAAVIREVMTGITSFTRDAYVLLITNPLDTVVWIAENEFDLPAGHVFGTGTMLDSARLRTIVAQRYGVDPKSVSGYMMGEHGSTAFPVLSHVNVAGIPYGALGRRLNGAETLTNEQVREAVVRSAYDVFNAKGWTNAGVAQSAITMARSILLDERTVHPASTTLRGEYGHDGDVALSMPCILGKEGIVRRIAVDLDPWETEQLARSIDFIRTTMAEVGAGVPAPATEEADRPAEG